IEVNMSVDYSGEKKGASRIHYLFRRASQVDTYGRDLFTNHRDIGRFNIIRRNKLPSPKQYIPIAHNQTISPQRHREHREINPQISQITQISVLRRDDVALQNELFSE